jgi:hypothetical protein
MTNFDKLSRYLHIWPPVQQVNGIGSKHRLIRHLDFIASITSSLRPVTKFLNPGDLIPNLAVLKRSHSDCGEHVIMPGQPGRDWSSLNNHPSIRGAAWFAQAHVPTLQTHGEWRVFIIGGKPIYVVHTKYNDEKKTWSWERTEGFYSLEEYRYVIY